MEETYDVVVIGSGPAGYVAAIRAAQLGLKVACIEKRETLGGTCLNVGCIPSKTLLHASELFWKLKKESKDFGVKIDEKALSFDWNQLQDKKNKVISGLNEGIKGLFKKNKITWITGEARFETPHLLSVSSKAEHKAVSASFFIIATGSIPIELPFLPFDEKKVLSSTGALSLEKIPNRLAVVGAGVIGVEIGSVFQRLGSQVTFIEFTERVCPQFDQTISSALQESLVKQGMKFFLNSKVTGATIEEKIVHLNIASKENRIENLEADAVLVAVGRKAYSAGLGLEKIGITLTDRGLIPIDDSFRTNNSHILAIGDVVEGAMLAHKASEEGVAAAEVCAGLHPSVHYMAIPNVVYTYPEVASVGFSEEDLIQKGISFLSGTYPFKGNSRARCTGEEEGFVKVFVDKKTDKVLGVHMIGPHVSELIAEGALALGKHVDCITTICHAHPTLSESLREAVLSIYKKAIHK